MEIEMMKMMQEMELADKTKRTFIQNFRHDLRTPISNIIGAADLMLHNTSDDHEFFLDSIKTSGNQLMSYVDQLTDATVSPKALLPVSMYEFDIREELESVIKGVNAIANVKKLAVQLQVSDAVPSQIKTDQIRLHRILSNLIGNAIKYTDEGEILVEVDYLSAKDGAVLEIHVIDSGVGIDDRFKQLIFSPMMRIRNPDGSDTEGAGLGLSIVKDFLNELSGQISVSSTPKGGSRFIIMIPLLNTVIKNDSAELGTSLDS